MPRIFSGIQPSGELHIGNYLGAVKNWVQLQHEIESFICIVDYHAITQPYEPEDLRRRTYEMGVSLMAAGIDPAKATLFVQSRVPEHTELAWIFNTVTPLGELERQTQFKDKSSRQESVLAGILNYPVLQAADILLYKADMVPVGEDQVQHLELSREIARRWNARFGEGFFPEPQARLTPTRRIMGLDGQAKMSKSLGNTVGLLETPDEMWKKLRPAMTDPARVRREDPGTPEICNIYHLHKAFSPAATVDHVAVQCRTAGWGCIDCKKVLFENMNAELTPIRTRAEELIANPIAREGCARRRRCPRLDHREADDGGREAAHGPDLTAKSENAQCVRHPPSAIRHPAAEGWWWTLRPRRRTGRSHRKARNAFVRQHPKVGTWCSPGHRRRRMATVGRRRIPMLLAAMQDAEVYFGFGLPRPLFLAAKKLRWVQSASAGVASLLYPEMLASDVRITNSAVIMGDPIAEQALSGILYFVRNLDIAVDQQRRAEWNKAPFVADPSMARELSECRALIVGTGGIGSALARRLTALGCPCTGVRRRHGPAAPRRIRANLRPGRHRCRVAKGGHRGARDAGHAPDPRRVISLTNQLPQARRNRRERSAWCAAR